MLQGADGAGCGELSFEVCSFCLRTCSLKGEWEPELFLSRYGILRVLSAG